ncbi:MULTISPECIES: DUF1217 domain-containing protein [Methylorubrum]|uniref:DUF1217 domain-containing protein n=2 Tax=Methylorubrum extorquens TaxID=408 RepID=C5AU56_METEA|nr:MULTISPECIES: DUF1217 domain-containing protein [Methylorubrum]ACS38446.1 hypothetical protein MexAM1_META1p0505 [Methylorubrum extorquens AM1]EHP86049.1 protein of unknown function DUF1217 [Methylorubrum extorquens DSM 13060]MCP1543494.1 hypothetical protein [Methylorubrum extorquens]MCP1589161.1 hypothetical protein [Methylorubrum extorquens]BDL37985.1 hypothetical protein MSPGM_05750 [Methylorubrum sp. GM97]
MTDTLTSYRLIAKDLPASLSRKAAEPTVAREIAYYEAHIGQVKSVDDLLGDQRLYAYAMKAYGLEDMTYAKAFMRKVLEEGAASAASFANRLADDRYTAFAKAFSFGQGVTATGADPARFGEQARAASLSAPKLLADSYDFSGRAEASFLVESRLDATTTQSVTIRLNAQTLAGQVANPAKVTPAEIAAAVAAQIEASALKGKVQAGLAADGSLFFETTALTDLGADGAYGGTGRDADTLVNAGGPNRTLTIRNAPLSANRTAVDVGFGTDLGPDSMAQAVTQAYLRQSLESEAGDADTGVRLALYFARKASSIASAYDILGDAALSQVANTVIGLPATSGAATSEALAKRAQLIDRKIDIASFRDPAKLDAFVRRFAAIWDAQNNTASAPILALFTGTGSLDAETLQSVQSARIGA